MGVKIVSYVHARAIAQHYSILRCSSTLVLTTRTFKRHKSATRLCHDLLSCTAFRANRKQSLMTAFSKLYPKTLREKVSVQLLYPLTGVDQKQDQRKQRSPNTYSNIVVAYRITRHSSGDQRACDSFSCSAYLLLQIFNAADETATQPSHDCCRHWSQNSALRLDNH